MTELPAGTDSSSDAELIARVRAGENDAFGQLFDRHQEAAHRLARQLVRGSDTDDLVSEAFIRVLQLLQSGSGPDVAFRAYLLTAVRRLHVDRIRSAQRVHVSDDLTPFDPGIPFQDTAVEVFERRTTARAFASLPERWQLVLWHLDVEGQKPAQIAPLLGLSANSVSALAYRAREGLRQAYLQMHLAGTEETRCRWTTDRLGAYVRNGLARRENRQVEEHLEECRRCTAVYLELVEVNTNLRGVLAPLLLGSLATGYVASTSAGAAGVGGVWALVSRAGDLVKGASQSAVTAGTVGTAAVAAVTLGLVLGPDNPPTTDRAVGAIESSSFPSQRPSPVAAPSGLPTSSADRSSTYAPRSLRSGGPTSVVRSPSGNPSGSPARVLAAPPAPSTSTSFEDAPTDAEGGTGQASTSDAPGRSPAADTGSGSTGGDSSHTTDHRPGGAGDNGPNGTPGPDGSRPGNPGSGDPGPGNDNPAGNNPGSDNPGSDNPGDGGSGGNNPGGGSGDPGDGSGDPGDGGSSDGEPGGGGPGNPGDDDHDNGGGGDDCDHAHSEHHGGKDKHQDKDYGHDHSKHHDGECDD